MDNTLISKITAVCVVLLMVGLVAIPLIQAANTEEETVTTTYTYGNNTIHDVNVSTVIGDVASSGASYTFSEDAGGDWMFIPSYVLRDTQLTYKVLDGAYIYVPDSATTYAQYTVNGTEIPVTGMSLTFTQDTTITDATVYDLTVNVTDMSLPGVVIEHVLDATITGPITNVASVYVSDKGVFYITNTGDLYGMGKNTDSQMGIGTNTDLTDWTLLAHNVAKIRTSSGTWNSGNYNFYISTTGELYASGSGTSGNFGDGQYASYTTWTKVADDVAEVYPAHAFTYYLTPGGALYFTGSGTQGTGAGAGVKGTWTLSNTGIEEFYMTDKVVMALDRDNETLYGSGAGIGLGVGSTSTVDRWETLASSGVTDVALYYDGANSSSFYLTKTGDIYATGAIASHGLMCGQTTNQTSWVQAVSGTASSIYCGNKDSMVGYVLADGTGYYSFGSNAGGSAGQLNSITGVDKVSVSMYTYLVTPTLPSNEYKYNTSYPPGGAWGTAEAIISEYAQYDRTFLGVSSSGELRGYDGTASYGGKIPTFSGMKSITASYDAILYTNPSDTVTISDVRGNVANGVFTPSETGTYLKVNSTNLQYETYYIGDGRTYYVAQNGTVSETKTAPDTTGLSHASLTFTALADPAKIYTVAGTTDAGYEVIIPYTASYDVTETVVTEKFPLIGIIPVIFVIMAILFVVNMIPYGRSGL